MFDICVPNTDDHARNHAAFWDGERLALTPALDAAAIYHLTRRQAAEIVEQQITVITEQWDDAAASAGLDDAEQSQLWGRQILNPAVHLAD